MSVTELGNRRDTFVNLSDKKKRSQTLGNESRSSEVVVSSEIDHPQSFLLKLPLDTFLEILKVSLRKFVKQLWLVTFAARYENLKIKFTQLRITCSKSAIETLKKGVKYV